MLWRAPRMEHVSNFRWKRNMAKPGPLKKIRNNVQRLRKELLMSKAELARKAGVSALTIERVESGKNCRMDTKRKIILALGLKLSDVREVFSDEEDDEE